MRHNNWHWLLACMVALLALAVLPAEPARAEFGTNWTVEFFNNTNLSGPPVLTQSGLPGVNFDWGTGSPAPGVNSDGFSARFSSVQAFAGGTYDFVVTSDDGVRLLIDGQIVLDRFYARPVTTDRFTHVLTPGNHSLVVEYFEESDQAQIQVQWFQTSPPAGGGVIITPVFIPQTTPFFMPTPVMPTAVPTPSGPQATITFVRGLALRTGPYLGASMITVLTRDVPSYPVLARNRSEGVYNWYLLQTPDGRQGWASGRYLDINVDVNEIPEQGSIFDEINDAPHIGVVAIPRANMVLRQYPSVRAQDIGRVGYGEMVELIGRTVQAGIDQWYHVRKGSTGEVGWIYAPWVTVRGEINQVPIR
ncbi:MAG: PA14 domain-containing protein [Chloroflexota bacterium]|nr:MAG: hypothetical protein DIU68_14005 [Chloroflexota bacterium]